jgi:hypothetical protein
MRHIYIIFAILCSSVFAQYPLKWELGVGGHFDAVFKYQDGTFDKSFLPAGGISYHASVEHLQYPIALRSYGFFSATHVQQVQNDADLYLGTHVGLLDFRILQKKDENWQFALYWGAGVVSSSSWLDEYKENNEALPNKHFDVFSFASGLKYHMEHISGFNLDFDALTSLFSIGRRYTGSMYKPNDVEVGLSSIPLYANTLQVAWFLGKNKTMGISLSLYYQYMDYYLSENLRLSKHEVMPSVKWAFRILPKQES